MVDAISASGVPAATAPSAAIPLQDSGAAKGEAVPAVQASDSGTTSNGRQGDSRFDDKTLDKIASRLVAPESRLSISEDDFIRRFIYKFISDGNGDVVHQYPGEMVVDALHAIEQSRERFLDERA